MLYRLHRYQEALAAVRRAQAVAGAFNAAVMNERAQVGTASWALWGLLGKGWQKSEEPKRAAGV